jgi:hypothetical protein
MRRWAKQNFQHDLAFGEKLYLAKRQVGKGLGFTESLRVNCMLVDLLTPQF